LTMLNVLGHSKIMAAKNSLKTYSPNCYYHIYNRGVEKRLIFQDEQDYAVFLSYLRTYLLPKDEHKLQQTLSNPDLNYKERERILKELRLNNFSDEITLLAYCLMPNHFHFLIKQKSSDGIDKFMNSFGVRYTMFFNRKYNRVGSLYQDVYKAVAVESEEQLLYLSSYIHRNPFNSKAGSKEDVLRAWFTQPSSYPDYLGQRVTDWIHPDDILVFFSKTNPQLSYQTFVEQTDDTPIIKEVALDLYL